MPALIDPRNEKLRLTAQVEERHQQPDLCTIFEPDSDGNSQRAKWITATGNSFLDAQSVR
jgi:hypothetical protein